MDASSAASGDKIADAPDDAPDDDDDDAEDDDALEEAGAGDTEGACLKNSKNASAEVGVAAAMLCSGWKGSMARMLGAPLAGALASKSAGARNEAAAGEVLASSAEGTKPRISRSLLEKWNRLVSCRDTGTLEGRKEIKEIERNQMAK